MNRIPPLLHVTALLLILGLPRLALAQFESFGDYSVYYSVVNSTFVTPDIAASYGITRGERYAFLNISVQQKTAAGSTMPMHASVTGTKRNLLQQSTTIDFREVQEGPAIYYIGEFEFTNAEPVVFKLEILPEGASTPHTLEWDTRVYINN